ncbi:hypothetical protein NC651_025586 [Populus alba x Populus x berolinensis]|nr:hypothetical protein NC651_025586 [Populus alba x Populus x berolinensis]
MRYLRIVLNFYSFSFISYKTSRHPSFQVDASYWTWALLISNSALVLGISFFISIILSCEFSLPVHGKSKNHVGWINARQKYYRILFGVPVQPIWRIYVRYN